MKADTFYVGLDIHAKHIAVCVLTEVGKIYYRSQVRTIDQMMRIPERLWPAVKNLIHGL